MDKIIFETQKILTQIINQHLSMNKSLSLETLINSLTEYGSGLIKSYIEEKIKDELALKNYSKIEEKINWLKSKFSNKIDLDFVSKILNDEIPYPPKIVLKLINREPISINIIDVIIEKLNELNIKSITLDGRDPLRHPYFKEIILKLAQNNFQIKVVTFGYQINKHIDLLTENVRHLKVKTKIDSDMKEIPKELNYLGRICIDARKKGTPLKSHLDVSMADYNLENLILYLERCIDFGISRFSLNLSLLDLDNFAFSKILAISKQYSSQIQFWFDQAKRKKEQNRFDKCYIPLLRWSISNLGEVYPCYRYGIEDKDPDERHIICNINKLAPSNYKETISSVIETIKPDSCQFCSQGDDHLNKLVNSLYRTIDIKFEKYLARDYFRLPDIIVPNSEHISLIEHKFQQDYLDYRKKASKAYNTISHQIKNANEAIDYIDENERKMREIFYGWHKMFNSFVARRGRSLEKLLNEKTILKKISDNVFAVKNGIKPILTKIIRDSIIITENIPFNFLEHFLKGINFENCIKKLYINQISTGAKLREIVNYVKNRRPHYLVGIGGGRVSDILKFVGWQTELDTISIPTSLTTHVYASPKIHPLKPIQDLGYYLTINGRPSCLSILDFHLLSQLKRNDIRLLRAGLGDILAFITARKDWHLAIKKKKDRLNSYADELIEQILRKLHRIKIDAEQTLWFYDYLEMQVLLCNITDWCGSAPASGSEHLFAKCAEEEASKAPLHGELVALGVLIMGYVHKLDLTHITSMIRSLKLPTTLSKIGLSINDVIQALMKSHEAGRKKRRYTIFEEIENSEKYFSSVIKNLLADGTIQE